MKTLLVIPPAPFLIDDKSLPPLGILSIATVIRDNGFAVDVLDLSGHRDYIEALRRKILTNRYDNIGFTIHTPQLPYIINMLSVIPPNIKTLAGGPHITSCYSAQKHVQNSRVKKNIDDLETHFDHLFVGDGEISIIEFLKGNLTKQVIDADSNNSLFLTVNYLDAHNWSDRSFVDLKSYKFYINDTPATSIISQLGCPFNCGFCCGRLSKNLRKIRPRSPEKVLKEIEYLYHEYGFKAFMFYDDELNVNKSLIPFLKDLISLQKKLGERFYFRGFVKSELFNEEQAKIMRECGFEWLLCGFESADDNILRAINKKATLKDNNKMLEAARAHGIKVKALMSSGHPGESPKTMMAIKKWLLEQRPDDFDLTIISPYPGSPYFDFSTHLRDNIWIYESPHTKEKLYSIDVDYTKTPQYYKGIPGNYTSYVYTDHMTTSEMTQLRDEIEQEVKNAIK